MSTWNDFLLLMLISGVVEIISCVYTETIILFDLGNRSRIFTSISKNNLSYLFWLEFAFPVS